MIVSYHVRLIQKYITMEQQQRQQPAYTSFSYSAGTTMGSIMHMYAIRLLQWLEMWMAVPLFAFIWQPVRLLWNQFTDFISGIWNSFVVPLMGNPVLLNIIAKFLQFSLDFVQRMLQVVLTMVQELQQQPQPAPPTMTPSMQAFSMQQQEMYYRRK